MASRSVILAITLVAACANSEARRAARAGEERLTRIDFEGNRELSDKTLLTGLALRRVQKRGGAPDPYLVQVDADRLRGEYLRKGYLEADIRSRVERKGDAATVIYSVEEGTRAVTRTVITGLPPDVPVADVRAALPLEDGQPFNYELYDLAKPKLLDAVQDAGYAHARLDSRVVADRANHTAIVELNYTPGPKSRFGEVEVTGATGELAEAARARVAFEPGQVYSTQAVVQTQRNLYGFGRFSTVNVQPDKSGGEVVRVKVAVAEGARHEVRLGGGVGIDPASYEVRGRAGYSVAGWPFPLDIVTLDLRPAYGYLRDDSSYEPRIRALGRLERQDLFWTYARGTVEAGYNYLAVEAYTRFGPLARLGFETRLGSEKIMLRVGWNFSRDGFRNIDPIIQQEPGLVEELGLDRPNRVGSYQQALVVDLRDHPIEPRLGAYGELRVLEGTRFAGGAYEYFAAMPDVRGFVPLFGGAVLAGRARYAAIWGDLPAVERLFAGGATSHRGFGERRLAPGATGTTEDGTMRTVPYGGASLIESSLEARVPITTVRGMPLGIAAFIDGGDVTESASAPDLGNLHWAAGGGLRLNTIVGPVRLDVAYRLNRKGAMDPAPGSSYAYHLTIGEAF
jgi:outer membrane protein assembly factor BamA